MVSVVEESNGLRIALTTSEKWAALRRSDLLINWSQLRAAEVVAEPYRLVHGLRAPGLALPWRTEIGIWRARGRKTFAVTRRHRAGLRLVLREHDFSTVLLSIACPEEVAERLQHQLAVATGGRPAVATAAQSEREKPLRFHFGTVRLGGTLLLPAAGHPVRGAALVMTGSGALDRDGSGRRAPVDVSLQIAGSLAASGIATLRYDKRGVGASSGEYLSAGFWGNVDDARAGLRALAAAPGCSGVPRFVVGHSEGAMIASVLAAELGNQLAGAVLLAMPAKTGEQTLV